ncbi:hypothetical protein B484DRAFT_40166 [Ochromonadaceae sp. CCMP2298]|nr:hypothetical protein B484DRAFT_40166 [Ochromonadaceae sp. CCMP2298]
MVCFSVGVSGSISCIIRSSPVYGLGRSGEVQIFSSGGRDQFVLEGVVVVLMTLGAALSAHLTSRATYIKFPLVRHLLVLLSMAVCATLFTHIFQVYVIKTPWYTLKDTMPPELHAWMAANVKKSSSLFKRLFRVSQIWLESKDLSGFYRKFKLLVVDYIMRSDLKK